MKKLQFPKLTAMVSETISDVYKRFSDRVFTVFLLNAFLIAAQVFYLQARYEHVNDLVPFWYTRTWGDLQFGQKRFLYFIPLISSAITMIGLVLIVPIKKYYVRYGIPVIGVVTVVANLLLAGSLVRIILVASRPFEPLIDPLYLNLLVPGILAFIAATAILPVFIRFAHDHDIVTNPSIHKHPAMLLAEPSARGGGVVYGILFVILAMIFVGFPPYLLPLYMALIMLSILGFLDDYQNTHPETKLRFMENPFIRLTLLFLIILFVSLIGRDHYTITNLLGGKFEVQTNLISIGITTVWIVWVLNVLSWSNGIDGQYGGIVAIASFLLIMLALRFSTLSIEHGRVALLAAISVGLSLGFTRFTWHPSKVLWGFGAMNAGLVLAVLSIMISSKIATSVLIILIPFLDAVVTVTRRIIAKKNPLKGDRGHLHHILLNRGWSVRKIAVFYWVTTALFGFIGFLTAEKLTIQTGITLGGVVAFVIIMLNLRFKKDSTA